MTDDDQHDDGYNDEDDDEDDDEEDEEEDLEEVDGSEAERCAHTERLKSRHQLKMKRMIILLMMLVMMATGMIPMVIMTMHCNGDDSRK